MARSPRSRLLSPIAPFLGTLLLLLPVASRATMVLDQVANPNGGSFTEDLDLRGYQSFTVGVTGELTEIDLWVVDPGAADGYDLSGVDVSATFDPQPGIPATDGFTNVVSGFPTFVDPSAGPLPVGWVPFFLQSPISVTAGDVLYFDLDAGPYGPVWGTSSYGNGSLEFICFYQDCIDPFSGGTVMLPPSEQILSSTADMAFRTVVYTPEPTADSLLALSALVLGALRSRRPASS